MNDSDLTARDLAIELALLRVGQRAVVSRISDEIWRIKFSDPPSLKQIRQREYESFWLVGVDQNRHG